MELSETPSFNSESSTSGAPIEPVKLTKKKSKKYLLISGLLLLLVVVAGGLTAYVYYRPVSDPVVRTIVNILPYPAVVINGERISIKEYLSEYDALAHFFVGQADAPSEDELAVTVVDTIINKKSLEQLADQYGVVIDDTQVEEMMGEVVAAPGGEEAFIQQLNENFGWDLADFKAKVVKSLVLANQMAEYVGSNQDLQQDRKAGIDLAMERLKSGEEFGVVAGDLSEDASAKVGGDIGFVPLNEMVDPWLSAIVDLEINQFSQIVESPENYMIFQVTDRITKEEDEEIKLSVIVVNKRTLDEVMKEFLASSEITRYLGKI